MNPPSTPDDQRGYYICDVCALKRKLTTKYPKGGNTRAQVPCGYCDDKKSFCTPIVDFKQSGGTSWD